MGLDAPGERGRGEGGVGDAAAGPVGEGDHEVQAGGRAVDAGAGQVRLDGPEHDVPALAVAAPDVAQVPFEFARVHQPGQDQLGEDAVAEVGVPLGRDQGVAQVGRDQQPADPQRGGEQLGDAARVADPVGQEGAQRGDGGRS